MSSFPDFGSSSGSTSTLSKKKRPVELKNSKPAVRLGLALLAVALVFGLCAYKGSWFGPSTTLNVPNQELHPQSIKKLGLITPDDPFQPYYSEDEKKIRGLVRNLQKAIPLSSSDQGLSALENQKVLYLTLHREAAKNYTEEDYALKYYPEINVVYFGRQFFQVNEATRSSLSQIISEMTPGWWS